MSQSSDIERLRALSGIKWRRYGDDVIPAWVADMDFPTAPAVVDALRTMVDASDFGYNGISFDDSIPKAWAEWSYRRFGWRPDPERTKVFSTSLQAIAAALAVGTSEGDGVLLFTPVYPPFFGMIEKSGRKLVQYRLDQAEWRVDEDMLRSAITPETRAMILCNPHNPSGRVFDSGELEAIARVAEERDLLVISDEIWQDFVYPGARHIPFASLGPDAEARSVTVTAASKSFSLGGLSCAVAHLGDSRIAEGIAALVPHFLGGVSALGARATLAAWTHGEQWLAETIDALHANRDHLFERLTAELPEIRVKLPEATYLMWLDFHETAVAKDPVVSLLKRGRVGLSPGPDFGLAGEGFARVNFATYPDLLDQIVDRIGIVCRPGG